MTTDVQRLGVSLSGYYDFTERDLSQRVRSNTVLDVRMWKIFIGHRQRYGAPRIADALLG